MKTMRIVTFGVGALCVALPSFGGGESSNDAGAITGFVMVTDAGGNGSGDVTIPIDRGGNSGGD